MIAAERTYVSRLAALLGLFRGCRGGLVAETRTVDGIAPPERFWFPTAQCQAIPGPLLAALRAGDGIRIAITSAEPDGTPRDLPARIAVFRPPTVFDAPARRHAVDPVAWGTIERRLAEAPPPAVVVHAGPEVVAWWPLPAPLPVDRDPAAAVERLVDLAARLGADGELARDLRATVPVAGAIRNWNRLPHPDWVDVHVLETTGAEP
jgi:hypothetical protein